LARRRDWFDPSRDHNIKGQVDTGFHAATDPTRAIRGLCADPAKTLNGLLENRFQARESWLNYWQLVP
jgi:hypothetical protein